MLEIFPSLKPFSTIAETAISIFPSFLVITHPIFNQAHGQREKDYFPASLADRCGYMIKFWQWE